MPIQVHIHFTKTLSNVVVKDVLTSKETALGSVTKGTTHTQSFDERNGEATVEVSGVVSNSQFVKDSGNFKDEDPCYFPKISP